MTDPAYSDLAYALSGYGAPKNPYDRRRQWGYQMLQAGADTSPILSPWQGAARLAQAIVGGIDLRTADQEEKADQQKRTDALAQAMAEPDPQKRIGLLASYNPAVGAQAAGQLAVEQAKLQQNKDSVGALVKAYGGGQSPMGAGAPVSPAALDPHFQAASQATGLPVDLLKRVGGAESSFNPNAVSPAGAGGVMQLMPGTAQGLGVQNVRDPGANIAGGAQYLRQQIDKYGNLPHALIAYNWGPGNTDAWLKAGADPSKLPAETQAYLGKILNGQQAQPPAGIQPIPNATGVATPTPIPNAVPGQAQPIPAGGPPAAPQPQQPSQGAMPGAPPAPTPATVSGPALVAPQVPQKMTFNTAPREVLAPYIQKLAGGGYGWDPAQADQRMRAEVQGEFDRRYEADKLNYEQKLGDYTAQRNQNLQQPQNTVQNESKMREQFDNLQTVKDFRKSSAIFSNAIDAAKTNSAAADLNLVYAFSTMMDPGSVVREGEQGMVRATQSASDQVKALVGMVSGGQRISPEARANLLAQMNARYQALKGQHDDLAKTFGDIAEREQMDRRNVVVPIPEVKYGSGASNFPPPPPGFRPL